MSKISCSVEILTFNSAKTLPRLVQSIRDFAEIIILDGGSTDGTLDIARAAGCRILPQGEESGPLMDFATVRNKGLAAAAYPWFLFVDSDEYISPELVEEIRGILKQERPSVMVYEVPRKYVIDGTVIEYSITYPAIQTRFFHRDAVKQFVKPVHERIEVRPGVSVGRLQQPIYVPQENVFFPRKWFQYLEIEAKKYRQFPLGKCVVVTLRRLGVTALYAGRYALLIASGKKPRAPWKFELSYIAYNFVHIFYLWRARLG
jgi:glycosyltransferase involved in cell wall biosynthesis